MTTREQEAITPKIAAQVLWYFGVETPHKYEAGSFVTSLLGTIGAADPINRALLAKGFESYVLAYSIAERHDEASIKLLIRRASEGG